MANIASMDYGRDTAGNAKLLSEYQSLLTTMANSIVGADYNNVLTKVQQYWAGADADEFVKNFKQYASNLKTKVTKYQTIVQNAVSADMKLFSNDQAKMASNIGSQVKSNF